MEEVHGANAGELICSKEEDKSRDLKEEGEFRDFNHRLGTDIDQVRILPGK